MERWCNKIIMVCIVFTGIVAMSGNSYASKDEFSMEEIEQILLNEGVTSSKMEKNNRATSDSTYTLGADDIISVQVMRHPEVSGQFIINKEGKIQYSFLGDLKVSDLVKKEVSTLLKDKLSKFIIEPEVIVNIIGYNSKIVYVVGEVGAPGKIFMRGDTITVREALMQASLPLLTAKSAKSALITPNENGQPLVRTVNVHKLLFKGDLRENLMMKPGDTLYVPPTIMAKALRVIQPIAAPIAPVRAVATGGF